MADVVNLVEPLRPPRPGKGSVDEQADAWLAYLYSGAATDADRRQFSQWLHESPAHSSAYAKAEQLWRDLGMAAAATQPGPQEIPQAVPAVQRSRRSRRPRRLRAAVAVAATLIAVFALGWLQFHDPATTRYSSATGEIRTIELADRSVVTLSGASAIVAHLSEHERRVELVSGRAYFDVVPDPQRAFFVKVAATEIRVVGTAFDVNKSPGGVEVSVTHGLVEVRDAAAVPDENPLGKQPAPAVRRIEAGQKLLAKLDGALVAAPERFDPGVDLGWKTGHLHYVNTRLESIVAEVNRYRDSPIVLADASLGDLRITTSFQTDQTDQLLAGLTASYSVEITPSRNGVVVHAR
jgi:transmembrane sensor